MSPITSMAILSLTPWVEAKGAVLYGYYQQLPLWLVFTVSIGLNLLAIPVVSFLWRKSLIPSKLRGFLENRLKDKMIKAEHWFSKHGVYTLAFFIGIPLTGLGLYTGVFVAEMMGLTKKQVYLSVALGMLMEVTVTFLPLVPIISYLRSFLSFV